MNMPNRSSRNEAMSAGEVIFAAEAVVTGSSLPVVMVDSGKELGGT
jgi:hypothetical protein